MAGNITSPIYNCTKSSELTTITKPDDQVQLCTICYGREARRLFVTECKHTFHHECLSDYVIVYCNDFCPNCRRFLSERDVKLLNQLPVQPLKCEKISAIIDHMIRYNLIDHLKRKFLNTINSLVSSKISPLNKNNLLRAMRIALMHLDCDYSAKIMEILHSMGGRVQQSELNSALVYAFKQDATYLNWARVLYKIGGVLTQKQLYSHFSYTITHTPIRNTHAINLFFEFGGKLNSTKLRDAWFKVINIGSPSAYQVAKYLNQNGASITQYELSNVLATKLQSNYYPDLTTGVSFLCNLGAVLSKAKLQRILLSTLYNFNGQDIFITVKRLDILFNMNPNLSRIQFSNALKHLSKNINNGTAKILKVLHDRGCRFSQRELKNAISLALRRPKHYTIQFLDLLINMGAQLKAHDLQRAIQKTAARKDSMLLLTLHQLQAQTSRP